jgi:hypothetical protein
MLAHRRPAGRIASRVVGTALAAVMIGGALVGCTSGGKHGGGKSDPPATPSAWHDTLNRIGPDGTVDVATALSAFSLAVGKVPGASVPAGRVETIGSATIAVSWVFAHWAELTAEQHAAVLAALGATAVTTAPAAYIEAPVRAPAPTTSPNVACLTADSAGAAPYRTQLAGIESEISAHLGRPLTVDKAVFLSVNTKDIEQPSLMYTWACDNGKTATGKITGCTIHINPKTVGGTFSDAEVRSFLIHEVTHCFLYDRFGMPYDAMPAWYVEGAPTFAMEVLGTSSTRLGSIWKDYLDTPTKPLAQRAYDGLGFFVHLAESGTDVWKSIDPIGAAMVGAGGAGTAAGWQAAGVRTEFAQSWGSGFVQGRYPGQAWTSTGPNLPPYRPALDNGNLPNGGTLTLSSVPFAAAVSHLNVGATVVLVNPGPATGGRLSLGAGADTALGGGPYCTLANCACPAGSPGADTRFEKMTPGEAFLGISGGDKGGSVTLVGQSLPDFCAKPPVSCLVGQWTSVGFDIATAHITEHGGAGVKMHIDPKGNGTVVFTGMAPVTFTTTTSNPAITGQLTYAGTTTGVMKLPPGGASSGQWESAGPGTVSGLIATVQITSPFKASLPPMDVAKLASGIAGAGDAVSKPELMSGTWTCTGDTLVTTAPPASGVTGTWTLTRTGPG